MNKNELSSFELKLLPKILKNNELMSFILSGVVPNDALARIAEHKKTHRPKVTEADLIMHARKIGLEPAQLKPGLRWLELSVALPIHALECNCGAQYEAPAGPLMVHKEHARFGTHYELCKEGVDYSALPQEHYYLYQKIQSCQACFKAPPEAAAKQDIA